MSEERPLHLTRTLRGIVGVGVLCALTLACARQSEYAADRHGVDILERTGYPAVMMMNTLSWLMQSAGASGGGFLATHPGAAARIEALRRLR